MPYEWLPSEGDAKRLHLWPYRSLTPHGFVGFIAVTAVLIALPLLAALGTPVLWALLPFLTAAVAGIWWALRRNARDAAILEDLTLATDSITLIRHDPYCPPRQWQANPHWVRVELHPTGGPVPNYLTLKGGPREVEIGAFLSGQERLALKSELERALRAERSPP